MMDLIDREQTIAALENLEWYHINANGELAEGANSACDTPLYKADDVYAVLRKEPSAEKTGLLIEGLKRPKVGERVILEITHGGEVIEIRDGLQVAGYTAIECGARMVDENE